jgi:hypothetical protein
VSQNLFGFLNVLSLIYLTGVVALVIGLQETEPGKPPARNVVGCWAKLLGVLIGVGVVVFVLSLFAG